MDILANTTPLKLSSGTLFIRIFLMVTKELYKKLLLQLVLYLSLLILNTQASK